MLVNYIRIILMDLLLKNTLIKNGLSQVSSMMDGDALECCLTKTQKNPHTKDNSLVVIHHKDMVNTTIQMDPSTEGSLMKIKSMASE